MARTTDPTFRNQTIYSIFIRNYSASGDFAGVIQDLDRISDLGVDIIWLLPIHPIGSDKRKGGSGSPYAISNYRGINPEYGNMDDFARFLTASHKLGMKVIIDIVFNHTSPDSLLRKVHPEWFWKNPDDHFGNRIGDWGDIIDLDYSSPELWDYQIETLKGWLREGVDGFRCDVAPLLPLSFWLDARDACAAVNPETIWLAETVEGDFINSVRHMGYNCLTDTETLRAFDISYDYDIYPEWIRLIDGNIGLGPFIDRLRTQESVLCDSDLKLRFIENHDQRRAAEFLGTGTALRQWTAYSLFAKGTALIYAGQEFGIRNKPNLFDTDPVDWSESETPSGSNLRIFIRKLIEIKKIGIVRDGFYWLPEAPEGCLVAAYERRSPDGRLTGIALGLFNVGNEGECKMNLKAVWNELDSDAVLTEMIGGKKTELSDGFLVFGLDPLILHWGLTS